MAQRTPRLTSKRVSRSAAVTSSRRMAPTHSPSAFCSSEAARSITSPTGTGPDIVPRPVATATVGACNSWPISNAHRAARAAWSVALRWPERTSTSDPSASHSARALERAASSSNRRRDFSLMGEGRCASTTVRSLCSWSVRLGTAPARCTSSAAATTRNDSVTADALAGRAAGSFCISCSIRSDRAIGTRGSTLRAGGQQPGGPAGCHQQPRRGSYGYRSHHRNRTRSQLSIHLGKQLRGRRDGGGTVRPSASPPVRVGRGHSSRYQSGPL